MMSDAVVTDLQTSVCVNYPCRVEEDSLCDDSKTIASDDTANGEGSMIGKLLNRVASEFGKDREWRSDNHRA